MTDVLSIVEAAYEIDQADDAWLHGIASAARAELDHGFGFAVFEFAFGQGGPPEIRGCRYAFMPDALSEMYPRMFARMGAGAQQLPFLRGPCTTGSEMTGAGSQFRSNPQMQQHAQTFGMFDSIWITAIDPSGCGLGLHAGLPEVRALSPEFRDRWARLGAHFAAALRLKRRLELATSVDRAPSESVFRPDGEPCAVADELAEDGDLESVRRAVIRLGELRRGDREDPALREWKPVVSRRWTLLDEFSQGPSRYVVARRNEPSDAGPRTLSKRERQVLSLAALGHDNKTIAYSLGVGHSTVRVLMARAGQKLQAKDRASTIERFRRLMEASE